MSVQMPIGANATGVFDARGRRMYSRTSVRTWMLRMPAATLRVATFWVALSASTLPRVIVRARGALSPPHVFVPRRFERLTEGPLPFTVAASMMSTSSCSRGGAALWRTRAD